MNTYVQSTGDWSKDGQFVARGYSGHGDGLNNPELQGIHNVGPIPVGIWKILDTPAPSDAPGPHGPFVMWLEPLPGTETFGRGNFRIHGDLVNATQNPNQASEGCIILRREVREMIWASGDRMLSVVADASDATQAC